jgi:hypothetical protein
MRKAFMQLCFKVFYEGEYNRLMAAMQQAKWIRQIERKDLVRIEYLTRLRAVLFTNDVGGGI